MLDKPWGDTPPFEWMKDNGYLDVFDEPEFDEPLYRPNERFKQDWPELWALLEEAHKEEIDDAIKDLILKGLVEVNGVTEDGEITYGLTEFGKQVAAANGL